MCLIVLIYRISGKCTELHWPGTNVVSISRRRSLCTPSYSEQDNPDNFLLGVRGNALTHDVELGRKTLENLENLGKGSTSETKLPRYDKSAYEGKGDRADEASWPVVKAPVDVVLFEGWMLGFTPVSDEEASKVQLMASDFDSLTRRHIPVVKLCLQ